MCFTMTNYIKGIDGCNPVWCNSSSHATMYCNYTPARKAGADPWRSKWSTHNWTPLLNGLENGPALHCRYKGMSEIETESQETWERDKYSKSERKRESERGRHPQVRTSLLSIQRWVFSIPVCLNPTSSGKCGADMSVLPCAPACQSPFKKNHR